MRSLLLYLVLLFPFFAKAQYFSDGQDRGGIKWKYITSVNFEIIFPEGFDHEAERVANLLETSYQYTTKTLKQNPKKVSVVLHNETVKSNAFLGWAPKRIEMYTTPHQRIYAQDWLEQLAIHEFRHLVQISKINDEMPKLLKIVFGEQAAALVTTIYLPFWFIEGDAVSAETGLSNSGRGRSPDFFRELRAQLVEKEVYSYDKAYLGSYKDHIANYYNLGYLLTGGARLIYNKVIWDDVLHHVATHPFSLNAFDKGLKNSIGLNKNQLYDTVFNYFQEKWLSEDPKREATTYQQINSQSKSYTNYEYVFQDNDSTIIALKTGKNEASQFVKIQQDKKEKVLFSTGYIFEESVSGTDSFIVWSERLPNIRWSHADRSLIRMYNWQTGKLIDYKYNRKLFAPSLSPNKEQILVVESATDYRFYLSLINVHTGDIVHIYSNNSDYFITPSWSSDGRYIYVVVLRNNQKGIVRISVDSLDAETIFSFDNQEISRPLAISNEKFLFIGGFSGIDNIYCYAINEKKLFEVVSSRFGTSNYSLNHNELVFNDYHADGYRIGKVYLDSSLWREVDMQSIRHNYEIATAVASQEPDIIPFSQNHLVHYQLKSYSKMANLLNVHSWAPIFIDPYNYNVHPGVSFMSQNLLSTAELVGGYRYRWQDNQGELYAKIKYSGCFPVIEAEGLHGKRKSVYNLIQNYTNSNNEIVRTDTLQKQFSWTESSLKLKTYLPIDLSKGKYYSKLQPRLSYSLSNINPDVNSPNNFFNGYYHSFETGVYGYKIIRAAPNDLLPNWGIIYDIAYTASLEGIANFGNLFALSTVVYLPGLFKNHGITLYNGLQVKTSADYSFADKIRIPRGHQPFSNNQIYSYGIDYQLPLCYPDISLGHWVYLKRVKFITFYDEAKYKVNISKDDPTVVYSDRIRSSGFELTTNCHFFRFIAPVELGFRSSYLFNNHVKFDFLFNLTFTL
jgi:hypothetical protein